MAAPVHQIMLVDSEGRSVDLESLLARLRTDDSKRILIDDEIGVVVYVGGLGLYNLKPTAGGEYFAQPVNEISRSRFPTRVIRRQIGATVLSVTADAVFIVRDGNSLKKVRAEHLEAGMILSSGEKVYR